MLVRAQERRAGRHAPWAAAPPVLVVLVALAFGAWALVADHATPQSVLGQLPVRAGVADVLTALVLAVAGGVLLAGDRGSRLGWVLGLGGAVWAFDAWCSAWVGYAASHQPVLPGAAFALWFANRVGAVLLLPFPLVLALYPDGGLPSGRWRRPVAAAIAVTAALPVVLVLVPASVADDRSGAGGSQLLRGLAFDPLSLPVPDAVARGALLTLLPLVALGFVVVTASVFARRRRATGVERHRLGWLLWAGVVDVLVVGLGLLVPEFSTGFGLVVAAVVTSGAVVVGVRTPRLVDVDALLGGTLVYGALAAVAVGLDTLVVAVGGAVLGDRITQRGTVLLVLLGATLLYLPVRGWLWRSARRVVLGERDQPYRVLATLAARLEAAGGPHDQLLEVAAAVASAFKVPYVAVEVDAGGERVVAEHGTAGGELQTLLISYGGTVVGRLRLPRTGLRARLTERDERLLGDVVRQAAVATRTAQLAGQLQAGREALVVAREEERRRIRRDLHDGLGPALAAVAVRIDTARNLAPRDPADADAALLAARSEVAAALADVRRLVHDLRPPALDDVGLEGALRQQAERLRTPDLDVTVDAAGLADLPAAVEVAAYRIASEAMLNCHRHASASTCRVLLRRDDAALLVDVEDDGVGIDPERPSGVGLLSVRERAAELGGSCEIVCPDGGGTVVRARLPLGAP